MKQLKPLWLKGIVTIKVTGHYPERFFDLCSRHDITVWAIKKKSDLECVGDVYLTDIKNIRKLRRKTHYKILFLNRRGLPFFSQKLKKYKQLLISFGLAALFFLYLTQAIWFIDIKGVPAEIEAEIRTSLNNYGVKRGKIKQLMDKPDQIQRQLLSDYANLLWIGVVADGVTYRLEVIPKKQPLEQVENNRTHLYAKKDGVISEMFVAKGRALVEVNDFVRKGQLLVTGELNPTESEDDQTSDFVPVEADIFATTWYESEITVPLSGVYKVETGLSKRKFFLEFGSFKLPIWGFGSTDFALEQIEFSSHTFSIGNWQVPLSVVKQTLKEVEAIERERSEAEAVAIGIEQARKNLLSQLDEASSIITDNILHQSIDSGKVKLHVYFTVNENIVNTTGSIQGD